MTAPLRVLPTPDAIGGDIAERILARMASARERGRRFLLGCPTGRTPRPIYAAVARALGSAPRDISNTVLVMMDEYLVPDGGGFRYAREKNPWTCHHFARVEILDAWNAALRGGQGLRAESIWFPDPTDPDGYDERIAAAGGIDLFLLASGASDGHVAFNPPGSGRDSRTRVIALSEDTRRDNLKTFSSFKSLDEVPRHGVSVGIATIAAARESVMVAWGTGKRVTVDRMRTARRYDPAWPATIIHECQAAEIVCDADAAGSS
jgi:glucosamine-6-phosphate deaminase